MNEIQTETVDATVDATAESIFSFDLFNQVDEEEVDETNSAGDDESAPAEARSTLYKRPVTTSILESAADVAPAELDQERLFRELIAQHQRRLYRFVIKYIDHPDDAADITQQAFGSCTHYCYLSRRFKIIYMVIWYCDEYGQKLLEKTYRTRSLRAACAVLSGIDT